MVMAAEDENQASAGESPAADGFTYSKPSSTSGSDDGFQYQSPLQKNYDRYKGTDADRNSKVLNISKATGDPPQFVDTNLEDAEKASGYQSPAFISELERKNPGIAKFLSNPANMAIGHDDLGNLAAHEDWAKNSFERAGLGTLSGIARIPGGLATAAHTIGGLLVDPYEMTPEQQALYKKTEGSFYKGLAWNPPADALDEIAKKIPEPKFEEGALASARKGDFRPLAANLISAIPSITEAIGLTATTGVGGAAVLFGGQATGESQKQAMEAGVSPELAATTGTAKGIVSGATMMLPMGIFKKQYEALANTYGPGMARAAMKQVGLQMLEGGGAMTAQGVAQQAANDFVDKVSGVNLNALQGESEKLLDTAFTSFATGAALPAVGHAAGMSAKASTDLYDKIRGLAKDSKVAARNPEAYASAVQEMVKGSPAEKTIINKGAFDRFFQETKNDPKAVADWLGARASYEESEKTGGLLGVEVPTENWLSKMRTKPAFEALKEDIKFSHDDLTANEEKEMTAQKAEEVTAAETEAQAAASGEEKTTTPKVANEQIKAIQKEISSQLEAIGQPKAYATDIGEWIKGISDIQKVDPAKLWEKLKWKIFGNDPMPETAEEMGFISPLDEMRKRGSKVLIERPDETQLTGGALEAARKSFDSNVQDYKSAGIPYTTDPNVKGATRPADLAQSWFDSANDGTLNRNALPEEWWKGKETGSGGPDADHDTIREIIRNSGSGIDTLRKLKQEGKWPFEERRITPEQRLEINEHRKKFTRDILERMKAEATASPSRQEGESHEAVLAKYVAEFHEDLFGEKPSDLQTLLDNIDDAVKNAYYLDEEGNKVFVGPMIKAVDRGYITEQANRSVQEPVAEGGGAPNTPNVPGSREGGQEGRGANVGREPGSGFRRFFKRFFQRSPESPQDLTKTPQFKKWFGKSKVVDEQGKPQVVYHGTDKEFGVFKKSKSTQGIFWFTSNKSDIEKGEVGAQGKGKVKDLYAKIENPASWDEYDKYGLGELQSRGYDGAILKNKDGSFTGFVFESKQLKSATKNIGEFNPQNPNIYKQGGQGFERGGILVGGEPGQRTFDQYVTSRADKSTLLHESAHAFWIIIDDLVKTGEATPEMKEIHGKLLDWFGVKDSSEVQEQHHEQFAKGMEWVLRGGDMPKQKPWLKRVYHLFRDWLLSTYPNDSDFMKEYFPLIVREMPQEIKDIYVRLRSTKDEIDRAAHESGMFMEKWKGMDPQTMDYIRDQEFEAMAHAEDELLKPQMEELSKKHQEFLVKERAKIEKQATKEVENLPISRAMESLKDLGDPKELADKYFEGRTDEKETAALLGEADRYGFPSPESLARDLKNFNEKAEVNRRVEAGMTKYQDMRLSPEIREKAVEVLHSEQMTELLALKGQYLEQLVKSHIEEAKELTAEAQKIREATNAANRRKAIQEARIARQEATRILSMKPWKESAKSSTYITAERRAYGEKVKALAKKDYAKAVEWNKKQVNAHALAAEALKNQRETKKIMRTLEPWIKRGRDLNGVPYGHARQEDGLLERAAFRDKPQTPQEQNAETERMHTDLLRAQSMDSDGDSMFEIANQTGFVKDEQGQWHQETLQEFVSRVNSDFFPLGLPPELATLNVKDSDSLNLNQLRTLRDAVAIIAANGKRDNKFLAEDITTGVREKAAEAEEHAYAVNGTPHAGELGLSKEIAPKGQEARGVLKRDEAMMLKAKETLKGLGNLGDKIITDMVTPLSVCEIMDGGNDGPWHQIVYRLLKHGLDNKIKMMDKIKKDTDALFDKHYGDKKDKPSDYRNQYIEWKPGQVISKMQALMILLNRGNEGNIDRLRRGSGLSDDDIQHITETYLNKHDFEYAQEMWDYFHTFWPDIVKKSVKLLGIEPKAVEPKELVSRHGTFKGGYFPIVYDYQKSSDAYKTAEQKTELFKQYSPSVARTEQGFTQTRVDTLARPLWLDSMDPIKTHLEDLAHDESFREPVIDVARFLRQKPVKRALENVLGVPSVKMLNDWLKSVAGIQTGATGAFERSMSKIRVAATYTYLGYRAVMIPRLLATNLVNGVRDLGFVDMSKVMGDYIMNRNEIGDQVKALMPQMKHRYELRQKELGEILDKWGGDRVNHMKTYAFLAENIADEMVSVPIAWRVYQRELRNGSQQRAIDMAQEAVTNTVGSGSILDQIGAQRGGEVKKMISLWGSWNFMMFNRAWRGGKIAQLEYRKENYGKAISIIALGTAYGLLAAGLDQTWKEIFRNPQATGSDEDEKRIERVIENTLKQPVEYVPYVGPLIGFTAEALSGRKQKFQFSAVEEVMTDLLSSVADTSKVLFGDKEADEKYWRQMATDVALFAHAPNTLINMMFNYWDWLHDNGHKTWQDMVGARRTKE